MGRGTGGASIDKAEGQALMRAWHRRHEKEARLSAESGYTALETREDQLGEGFSQIAHKIITTPAATMEGAAVKLRLLNESEE